MEHIRDSAARCDRIHRDLLMPAVLGHDAHEGLDRAFGAGVKRVLRHRKVLGRIRGHQDNTAALAEVAVGLARDEELRARVDSEDTVEFFLWIYN